MGDKLLLKLNNYEKPIANKYYEVEFMEFSKSYVICVSDGEVLGLGPIVTAFHQGSSGKKCIFVSNIL